MNAHGLSCRNACGSACLHAYRFEQALQQVSRVLPAPADPVRPTTGAETRSAGPGIIGVVCTKANLCLVLLGSGYGRTACSERDEVGVRDAPTDPTPDVVPPRSRQSVQETRSAACSAAWWSSLIRPSRRGIPARRRRRRSFARTLLAGAHHRLRVAGYQGCQPVVTAFGQQTVGAGPG